MSAFATYASTLVAGCAAGNQRNAEVQAVVLAGAAGVEVLRVANRGVYERRSREVMEALAVRDGTLSEFKRELAPLTATFASRGAAVDQLSSALRVVLRALEKETPPTVPLVRRVLMAVTSATAAFSDTSVLPGIPLPPQLRDAVILLEGLLGGGQCPDVTTAPGERAPAADAGLALDAARGG